LRVFENRVLRKIFGPKREEVVEGWRRLYSEELHNLCGSPNIIMVIKSRRMRWTEHAACMGEMRSSYKILVGKPEGNRQCGRHNCRWEDNIRINLKEIGWEGVDWIHPCQNRDWWQASLNTVMNVQIP
jgi:hypothetical protein